MPDKPELKINPSTMLAKALLVFAVVVAIAIVILSRGRESAVWMIALAIPAILVIVAVKKMIMAQYTVLEMAGDRLKFETGMMARSTRSMPIAKVQDVTVTQSFGQRLLGLGNLTIETAGEAGGWSIREIASPRVVAEQILDRVAEQSPSKASDKSSKGRS